MSSTVVASAVASAGVRSATWVRARMTVAAAQPAEPVVFSLHATFGFPQRTGVDWLGWLVDEARRQGVFRHDLARHDTEGRCQRDLVEAATQLVTSRPYARFLADREDTQSPARHVRTHGLFGPPPWIACLTEYPPRIVDHERDQTVVVHAAGRTLTLDACARAALEALLSGHPVDIGWLDESVDIDAAALAQVLVDEEICTEVHPELAAGYADLVAPIDVERAAAAPAAGPAR